MAVQLGVCVHTMNRFLCLWSAAKYIMIVKRRDGYYVTSKDGENLGGPYSSRLAASRRLKEVEFFKKNK